MSLAARGLFAVVILFFFSMYKSCSEFSYMTSSVEAKAKNVEYGVARNTKGTHVIGDRVKYSFWVDQKQYIGSYVVDSGQGRIELATGEIDIEYIESNPKENRVLGESALFWVILFFVFLVGIFGFLTKIYFEASEDVKKSRA